MGPREVGVHLYKHARLSHDVRLPENNGIKEIDYNRSDRLLDAVLIGAPHRDHQPVI